MDQKQADPKKSVAHTRIMMAYIGLVLTVFFWSVNTVLARGMIFTIKPMALSFYRWVFAFAFIMPFAIPRIKQDWPVIKDHIVFLSLLAVFSVAAYNSIVYLGAQYTTATNIALVIATMPGITIILAWVINRDRTNQLQIFGAGASFIGMVVIVCKGSLQVLTELQYNPGDVLIVLAILSWAFYSVLLRSRQINLPPVTFLATLIFIGVICIFPFYLWEYSIYKGFEINLMTLGLFVFLGIFPSILSYLCWNFGVKIVGSSTASIYMYLIPVFTSILAWFFLGERLYNYHFSGGFLIFIGLIMSTRQ